MDTRDRALQKALHTFQGAPSRWEERRLSGMNDAELRQAIGTELGLWGGFLVQGLPMTSFKGGKNPEIWIDTSYAGKPTFRGKVLVDAARRVLRIPVVAFRQMDLFKGGA